MKLGIIGGSGLYNLGSNFKNCKKITVDTPFGVPSDELVSGFLGDVEIVFLARHGVGHTILPGEINHKANIYAMKKVGVTRVASISAVGSLKENLKPRDVVIVDQFFDRTKRGIDHTFFGNGIVGHISFADPVCGELSEIAYNAAVAVEERAEKGVSVHKGGTYVNMEGPAFSTKAESLLYQSWGMDVIGMTNLAEAKLAREAGVCYSSVAMVTDFDCWHDEHESVTLEMILGHLSANVEMAKDIIIDIANRIAQSECKCDCSKAAEFAIVTNRDMIPSKIKRDLSLIFPELG